MNRSLLLAGSGLALALLTSGLCPGVARAQMGPSPMGGGAGGGTEPEKPEGVAEAAPKTPGLLPTTPTLPPPRSKRNKFELFELDGYFRLRMDYLKNLNLSFRDDATLGGAPFPRPIACSAPTGNGPAGDSDRPCGDSLRSSNVRLRLEPTINVNESTSVHMQIDVLDNLVLGSTPAARPGTDVPLGAFDGSQDPPVAGDNWSTDSIRVKRAWAEVQTPLGILKFGRQPSHWGMGIYQNSGSEDPIDGGYDRDADYGDTVDRLSFSTQIPGTPLRAAIAYDWPFGGPTSATTDANRAGQPFDLDNNDDVFQWVGVLSKMESPADFRDAAGRGELALDYGAYFTYRTQKWDYTGTDPVGSAVNPDAFVPRDSTAYIPDAWVKLAWKNLSFEAELVGVLGNINRVKDWSDADGNQLTTALDLRQLGGVGRFTMRAVNDKLKFGAEVGGASGDQYDHTPQGATSPGTATRIPDAGDHTWSAFALDPDFHVDLILWRELYGAVTNAVYAKPFLSYELTKSIGFKVANITSFALKPIATPGNATTYGTEFDADLGYDSSSFSAGLAYGFFVPLAAMDHPDTIPGYVDPADSTARNNSGSAGNAHTVQARFVVKF